MGPEADKYRLSVSGFSGDEGDAIVAPLDSRQIVNGMKFGTPDQDNDNRPSGPCSKKRGWWYNWCTRSALTYHEKNAVWNAYTAERIYDVIFARMMVRLD